MEKFDGECAVIWEEIRFDSPEIPFIAPGPIESSVHVIDVAPVSDGLRIISFGNADDREVRKYGKEKALDG